jgi:hypothetical protein
MAGGDGLKYPWKSASSGGTRGFLVLFPLVVFGLSGGGQFGVEGASNCRCPSSAAPRGPASERAIGLISSTLMVSSVPCWVHGEPLGHCFTSVPDSRGYCRSVQALLCGGADFEFERLQR